MIASPRRPPAQRVKLGPSAVHTATSSRYLRHVAAADEAYRTRQRALRRNRVLIAVIALLFYFVIGRDLIAVARAKKDNAVMEVKKDAHDVTSDISSIAKASRNASDQSVLPSAPTSAGGSARSAAAGAAGAQK